jgi:hypothetical protein
MPSVAGGAHCLLNSRGYDCTALFESYHPFTDKPRKILEGMTPVRSNAMNL